MNAEDHLCNLAERALLANDLDAYEMVQVQLAQIAQDRWNARKAKGNRRGR